MDLWVSITERGSLKAGITASTPSQGQRQLLSCARAVLRRRSHARSLGLPLVLCLRVGFYSSTYLAQVDHATARKMRVAT
ncbi:hypothetical protein F5Y18DRAFT_377496 [Xylariaceae sp. FL1019]|nr:hypothetical protein F5Y18DRAFT_377496 [Xylariaceae sp. FL1019]